MGFFFDFRFWVEISFVKFILYLRVGWCIFFVGLGN